MIKKKYQLTLSLVTMVLIIVGNVLFALDRMNQVDSNLDKIINEHVYHANLVEKMIYHARERTLLLFQISGSNDLFEIESLKELFYLHGADYIKARASVLESDLTENEKNLLNQHNDLTGAAVKVQYKVIELSESGDLVKARLALKEDFLLLQDRVITLLQEFIDLQNQHNLEELDASAQVYIQTVRVMSVSVVVVIGLGVFLVYYTVRRFSLVNTQLRHREDELSITNKMLNQNVTDLNEMTNRLQKSEQQERAIRENMLDAVVTIDKRGIIESCNPATEKMFGYTAAEMLGKNVSILMPDSFRDKHDKYLEKYRMTGQGSNMNMARSQQGMRKDRSIFHLDIGLSRMQLDGEIKVVGIMRDITERVEAEKIMRRSKDELEELVQLRTSELEDANQQLIHLARHDALTGLANRTLLEENLKVAIAYAKRNRKIVAFMFIDLDGFKQVNDDYGHDVGDQLLIKVAHKLKTFVRVEDCVSRIGGDEFVIMLFGLNDKQNVSVTAGRIIDDLSEPMTVNGHAVNIGASIGISLFPDDAEDCMHLIKCADDAMYQVKKSGKNNFIFFGSKTTEF